MKTKKKMQHGGKRAGSGRPKNRDPKLSIPARLPASQVKQLRAWVKDNPVGDDGERMTTSSAVAFAVRSLLESG